MVVGDVGVGGTTAPGKLQHHHAWRSNGFAKVVHIGGDHSQVLSNDCHVTQLLQKPAGGVADLSAASDDALRMWNVNGADMSLIAFPIAAQISQ